MFSLNVMTIVHEVTVLRNDCSYNNGHQGSGEEEIIHKLGMAQKNWVNSVWPQTAALNSVSVR